MPTIYEIADDLRALHDLLAESGGEVTPETEAAFAAFEAEMLANTSEKLDRYCSLIAELDATAAARKAEAKRLADLARTDERTADSLRERLRWFFETHGIAKQKTSRFAVSLVQNGGKPPLVLAYTAAAACGYLAEMLERAGDWQADSGDDCGDGRDRGSDLADDAPDLLQKAPAA